MRFNPLFCIVLCLALCSCNGARVTDNRYTAFGAEHTVASDMHYVGEVPLSFLSRCTGPNCTYLNTARMRAVEDIFVLAEEERVKEFVLIGFRKISGAYHWTPIKADKVVFAGSEYAEIFQSLQAKDVGDPYMSFLTDAGYREDAERYFMRFLLKNSNEKTQVYLIYVCSENMLPEKDRDNPDQVQGFLRTRMAERFLASDG